MIDVLICEDSFASDICKAKTSALRAALHISPFHARGDLSEINQQQRHARQELRNLGFVLFYDVESFNFVYLLRIFRRGETVVKE